MAQSAVAADPDKVSLKQGVQGLAENPNEASIEEVVARFGEDSRDASVSGPSGAIQMLLSEVLSFGSEGLDAAMSPVSAALAPAFLRSVTAESSPRVSAVSKDNLPARGRIIDFAS